MLVSSKVFIKKDLNLLERAIVVFGEDLVKTAYVAGWGCYSGRLKNSSVKLQKLLTNYPNCITYDEESVVIEFCNGNLVLFSNSEWARIEKLQEYKVSD